ncbi:MAG: hypothetical protein HOE30_01605 [Deltaproteobacteria bacterium]|nr:hypothetical protein [Deltaproteobacteria bacterium]MBT4640697.1 hypothetical protein [Deltaproteobacteria bacterium]
MNAYEIEFYYRNHVQRLINESQQIRLAKVANPKVDIIKKLILMLSEAFIATGIFLHNIYQPPIEETLREYCAALESAEQQRCKMS